MFKSNEVHRVYEAPAHYWSVVKRQVSESPMTAIGVAAGAGLLAYSLLKPKPARRQNFFVKASRAVTNRRMRSGASRTLKSLVGSLALGYINRRLKSKLHWR
jgi:hypothetical protein